MFLLQCAFHFQIFNFLNIYKTGQLLHIWYLGNIYIYSVIFYKDSAFVRVKPERRGVSHPATSTCGPLAAPSTSHRGRVTSSHDSTPRGRPPRQTTTLAIAHDVVRPTPIGQVFFSCLRFTYSVSRLKLTNFHDFWQKCQ